MWVDFYFFYGALTHMLPHMLWLYLRNLAYIPKAYRRNSLGLSLYMFLTRNTFFEICANNESVMYIIPFIIILVELPINKIKILRL